MLKKRVLVDPLTQFAGKSQEVTALSLLLTPESFRFGHLGFNLQILISLCTAAASLSGKAADLLLRLLNSPRNLNALAATRWILRTLLDPRHRERTCTRIALNWEAAGEEQEGNYGGAH